MAKSMNPIKVTSESDLMDLLDEADSSSPVLLERRGVVYQLSAVDKSEEVDVEWDAEAVRRNLDETLGSWADLDIDKVIEHVYRARREGSREPIDP